MVEFDILAALVAGFIATLVMTAMMQMSAQGGMTDMPPMTLISGSMLAGDRSTANKIGAVIHFVVMGTVMFGRRRRLAIPDRNGQNSGYSVFLRLRR